MLTQSSNDDLSMLNKISNELKTQDYDDQDITNSIDNVKSRLLWHVNSPCNVYSRSKKKWFNGTIVKIITNDSNEEWLIIRYGNLRKEIQRFNTEAVQPVPLPENYTLQPDIIKLIAQKLKENKETIIDSNAPPTIPQLQKAHSEIIKTLDIEEKELNQFDFTDLSVFENKQNDTISAGDSCNVESCKKTQRLLCCLQFYTKLNVKNNENDRDKFDQFMHQKYTEKRMLDDYLHFTKDHKHDLEKIRKMLNNSDAFDTCDEANCRFRTHGKDDADTDAPATGSDLDQLHVLVFHTSFKEDAEREEDDVNFVDKEFARMAKKIQEQKANQTNFENKDKFTIQVIDKDKDRTTYIDGLFKYLRSKKLIETVAVDKFEKLIKDEEYDTDPLLEDMQVNNKNIPGNIELTMKDDNDAKHVVAEVKIFIRVAKSSKSSFSVGIRFYYWPFFKGRLQLPKEELRSFNQNDHGGRSISDLYVERKYKDFQEEISNYQHIAWTDYQSEVVAKANRYKDSERVKAMTSAVVEEAFERLHYDIPEGTVLGYDNLVSLILYTDFSALCSDFSSTFRKVSAFEALDSVKNRNREYYWMSRKLRETVECFGYRGCGDWNGKDEPKWNPKNRINKLEGPFYTGMNCVMIMPEFNLRLCSPTSTSASIQIALNFSGVSGIIIQLNNDKKPGDLVRGFDCSWISRYKLEEERLFFGGFFRIRIEGIRLRATNENFYDFFLPLFYLDALITGTRDTEKLKLGKNGRKIILKLLEWKRTDKDPGYNKYITETFESFCINKRQISLDLFPISKAKKSMMELIMYGVEKDTGDKKDDDTINLFRKDIFEVFENVTRLEINTFWWDPKVKKGRSGFSLSLLCLLSIIESTPLENVTVKVPVNKDESNGHWLNKLWSEKKDLIEKKYEEKGYKVEVKHIEKKFADEDWFIVKR